MIDERSFENKNILITGASGFIGHALASALSKLNLSLTRTTRDASQLPSLDGTARIVDAEIDYADALVWDSLVEEADIIFHLAAQTSSAYANENPAQDFQHNVLPLLNLLECCKKSSKRASLVFSSTATVVGLTENLPVGEETTENPITVYDVHKLCCEKYLSYYAKNGYINSCSLRLANVYGPGSSSSSTDRGILNLMIRRAINKETLSIFGEGLQIRDYSYIDDIVSAFLCAAASCESISGSFFNVGSGHGHTFVDAFNEISEYILATLKHEVRIDHVDPPHDLGAIEARSYVADTEKFSNATGWSAAIDLRTGIKKTVDQYLM